MTKLLKPLLVAFALVAGNAQAFYGTTIENHKPNPWLERPSAASTGATRPNEQAPASRDLRGRTPIERFWAEVDRTSASHASL
jgi:hypothetical protein